MIKNKPTLKTILYTSSAIALLGATSGVYVATQRTPAHVTKAETVSNTLTSGKVSNLVFADRMTDVRLSSDSHVYGSVDISNLVFASAIKPGDTASFPIKMVGSNTRADGLTTSDAGPYNASLVDEGKKFVISFSGQVMTVENTSSSDLYGISDKITVPLTFFRAYDFDKGGVDPHADASGIKGIIDIDLGTTGGASKITSGTYKYTKRPTLSDYGSILQTHTGGSTQATRAARNEIAGLPYLETKVGVGKVSEVFNGKPFVTTVTPGSNQEFIDTYLNQTDKSALLQSLLFYSSIAPMVQTYDADGSVESSGTMITGYWTSLYRLVELYNGVKGTSLTGADIFTIKTVSSSKIVYEMRSDKAFWKDLFDTYASDAAYNYAKANDLPTPNGTSLLKGAFDGTDKIPVEVRNNALSLTRVIDPFVAKTVDGDIEYGGNDGTTQTTKADNGIDVTYNMHFVMQSAKSSVVGGKALAINYVDHSGKTISGLTNFATVKAAGTVDSTIKGSVDAMVAKAKTLKYELVDPLPSELTTGNYTFSADKTFTIKFKKVDPAKLSIKYVDGDRNNKLLYTDVYATGLESEVQQMGAKYDKTSNYNAKMSELKAKGYEIDTVKTAASVIASAKAGTYSDTSLYTIVLKHSIEVPKDMNSSDPEFGIETATGSFTVNYLNNSDKKTVVASKDVETLTWINTPTYDVAVYMDAIENQKKTIKEALALAKKSDNWAKATTTKLTTPHVKGYMIPTSGGYTGSIPKASIIENSLLNPVTNAKLGVDTLTFNATSFDYDSKNLNLVETVYYNERPATIKVHFRDVDKNAVPGKTILDSNSITGLMEHTYKNQSEIDRIIKSLTDKNYVLQSKTTDADYKRAVSGTFDPTELLKAGGDTIYIDFVHKSKVNVNAEQSDVTQTINYINVNNNNKSIAASSKTQLHFSNNQTVDLVTNKVIGNNWNETQDIAAVTAPVVEGYHIVNYNGPINSTDITTTLVNQAKPEDGFSSLKIAKQTYKHDSKDVVQNVYYDGDTQRHDVNVVDVNGLDESDYTKAKGKLLTDYLKTFYGKSDTKYDNSSDINTLIESLAKANYKVVKQDGTASTGTYDHNTKKHQESFIYVVHDTDEIRGGKPLVDEAGNESQDPRYNKKLVLNIINVDPEKNTVIETSPHALYSESIDFKATLTYDKVTGDVLKTKWDDLSKLSFKSYEFRELTGYTRKSIESVTSPTDLKTKDIDLGLKKQVEQIDLSKNALGELSLKDADLEAIKSDKTTVTLAIKYDKVKPIETTEQFAETGVNHSILGVLATIVITTAAAITSVVKIKKRKI